MSMRSSIVSVLPLALAACGSSGSMPDASTTNPTTLWIAPNGDERHVKLVDTEPPPW